MTAHVNENGTVPIVSGTTRPSRRVVLLGSAGAGLSLAGLAPSRAAQTPAKLRRGGSIHTLLNWPQLLPGSRDQMAWPPFTAAKYQIDPGMLMQFRAAGLDFIRLTIDPGLLLATSGVRRKQVLQIITDRCDMLNQNGFYVIADLHPINQIATFTPEKILATPALFEAYARALAELALSLDALNPARIALEVFNEPPYGYDQLTIKRWASQMHRMHRLIRERNDKLTLVLSGSAGGGIRGLLDVDARAFADSNLIWSFHYYDPHLFTHQGVATSQPNMLWYKHLTDLPYPASHGHLSVAMESLRQNLRLDKSLNNETRKQYEAQAGSALASYFNPPFAATNISADFAKVADWAARNGVSSSQILLGEFGAARRNELGNGPSETHRLQWLRDIRLEAEKRGFAWALWDINAPQMGMVRKDSKAMDPDILDALGLAVKRD